MKKIKPPQNATLLDLRGTQFMVNLAKTKKGNNTFSNNTAIEWNQLPSDIQLAENIPKFKTSLLKTDKFKKKQKNNYYYFGPRHINVILCKLRNACSQLKKHTGHLIPSNIVPTREHFTCACKIEYETPEHYFFRCPLFEIARRKLKNALVLADFNIKTLLHGNLDYNLSKNKLIFEAVSEFIDSSKRF
jgi:hypothetical protein